MRAELTTDEAQVCRLLESAIEYAEQGWWLEAGERIGAAVTTSTYANSNRVALLSEAWLVREILCIWCWHSVARREVNGHAYR